MFFREFRINVTFRTLIITGLSLALAFVLVYKSWFFTPLVLSILLLASLWNLIYYIEKTNKDLTHFILSLKQGGFTTSFPPGKRGEVYKKLANAFNDVIDEFRKVNLQRETHYHFLQVLTENIQAGIIGFYQGGEVMLINPEAKRLLHVSRLNKVNELNSINPRLYSAVSTLSPGQRQLLRVVMNGNEARLSLQVKELIIDEKQLNILLMQDLNVELELQEVEAWQKLIRVITHEIMNSVTPIVSLTESLNKLLVHKDGSRKSFDQLDDEDKEDLYGSLETIENRSKGLLRFVNAYKDFTKTPELTLSKVDITALIRRVVNLMHSDFEKHKITLDTERVGTGLISKADAEWLEQVFINVFKNAVEALEGCSMPKVKVATYSSEQRLGITISDNGPGMDADVLDKVFIPFFTTKKKGSGIGLSFSRQIMRLHGGNLSIQSAPGKGTSVELLLEKA